MTDATDPSTATISTVARNVRALRTEQAWTLDELAGRSGVSKGMLVQIEQNRTNPSIGTLCRIAEAFGVSLASLVELGQSPAGAPGRARRGGRAVARQARQRRQAAARQRPAGAPRAVGLADDPGRRVPVAGPPARHPRDAPRRGGHADAVGRRRRPRGPGRFVGAVRGRPPPRLRQQGTQGAALHHGRLGARAASTIAATVRSTATLPDGSSDPSYDRRDIEPGGSAVDVNDLIEIEAIKRVKYRYMRTLDQKLWDEMATCFTEDAVGRVQRWQVPLRGARGHPRVPVHVDGRRDLPVGPPDPPARDRPHRRRPRPPAPGPWTTWW